MGWEERREKEGRGENGRRKEEGKGVREGKAYGMDGECVPHFLKRALICVVSYSISIL
jgi:hypothetical protein